MVSLEAVQNCKRITSINQRTTAFQVFVAVYTIRFPDSTPGRMKYSATVRDLAAKDAHWRYYDENFRYLRRKKFLLFTLLASLVYVRGKSSVEITCLWQKIENQKQNKTLEKNLAFDWQKTDAAA